MEDFIIDKVEWHSEVIGNPEPIEKIHARFRNIINFLQDNNLTKKIILSRNAKITNETYISTEDLTEEGFLLMKNCYDKWLHRLARGKSPEDLKIFEKYLSSK